MQVRAFERYIPLIQTVTVINLKVLTGNRDGICRTINMELKTAFDRFLRSTGRLIQLDLSTNKKRIIRIYFILFS